jgi:hypothetical protein
MTVMGPVNADVNATSLLPLTVQPVGTIYGTYVSKLTSPVIIFALPITGYNSATSIDTQGAWTSRSSIIMALVVGLIGLSIGILGSMLLCKASKRRRRHVTGPVPLRILNGPWPRSSREHIVPSEQTAHPHELPPSTTSGHAGGYSARSATPAV